MAKTLGKTTDKVLVGSVVGTAVLYAVPGLHMVAYPLLLLSTLAHEMGHGLTAILVGAHFNSFQMWSNGSGVAAWSGNVSRLSLALVAAGGLVGPAVASACFFALAKKAELARLALTILGVLLIVAEFLVIRNSFGWIFVGILAAIFLYVAQQNSPWLAQTTLVFLAMQLALSVFSRMDYLFTKSAQTSQGMMPSDVAQMAHALFLPYWFWGGVCAAFSVAVLFLGMRFYLGK